MRITDYLASGADVNFQDPTTGSTTLHLACQDGDSNMVKALIANGADVNLANNDGYAPINSTTNPALKQLLINNGAYSSDPTIFINEPLASSDFTRSGLIKPTPKHAASGDSASTSLKSTPTTASITSASKETSPIPRSSMLIASLTLAPVLTPLQALRQSLLEKNKDKGLQP